MRVVRLVILTAPVARRSLLVCERGVAGGDERRNRWRFRHFDSCEGSNRTPAELTAAKFVHMLGEKSEDENTIKANQNRRQRSWLSFEPRLGRQSHSVGWSEMFLAQNSHS